jgi:hypothetical protein
MEVPGLWVLGILAAGHGAAFVLAPGVAANWPGGGYVRWLAASPTAAVSRVRVRIASHAAAEAAGADGMLLAVSRTDAGTAPGYSSAPDPVHRWTGARQSGLPL